MIGVIILVAAGALLYSVTTFVPPGTPLPSMATTAVAFGFVLLSSFFTGRIVRHLGMPRVTGYLLLGVLAGPFVLNLVTSSMVQSLSLINGVAVCLIALTAGGELSLRRMKPLLKTINSMVIWGVLGTTLLLTAVLFLIRSWLPFLAAMELPAALAVCLMLAIALASQSPAVVMALRTETAADGPVSQTMLGLVVISDLVVILLYALASSLAKAMLGGAADPLTTLALVAWELFGSLGAGLVVGVVLGLYLKRVNQGVSLFVLLICIVVAEVGKAVHLDPLLVTLAAGVWIENVAEAEASDLIHELEGASLPIYVVFFAVAGAVLDLGLLWAVAVPATVITLARAGGFFLGCKFAAKRAGSSYAVARYTWVGLLPQAGLALALALLLQRAFPDFGMEAAALVLGVVGLNQLVSPIFLRLALIRSGEAGQREVHGFLHDDSSRGSGPPSPVPDT